MELPTIVFDEIIPESNGWSLTRKKVVDALEEFGSFRAIYSVISPEQDSCLFYALRDLFDLPKETKCRFTLCESFQFHATKMAYLNRVIRKMVFEAYGVDKYFEAHDKAVEESARVMRYGAPMSTEAKGVGAAAHYDVDFLTILHENGLQGLQVKAKHGDYWITGINCSDSSFVAMAGELLRGWSNGRIHSPLHRVVTSGFNPRFSIGLFASEKGLVEAPSELVDDQHPRLFKPFDRISMLNVLKSNGGYEPNQFLPLLTTHYAL